MNRQEQDSNFEQAMKHINTEGMDGMGSAIQVSAGREDFEGGDHEYKGLSAHTGGS